MATVQAGVARYADVFKTGAIVNATLGRLSSDEQNAAKAALAKIGVGDTPSSGGAPGGDTVVVGSGNATLLGSPAHQPVVSSSIGSDTVLTGSINQGQPLPGAPSSTMAGDTITQVGQTADTFKTPTKTPGTTLTMSDKTTINLIGVHTKH